MDLWKDKCIYGKIYIFWCIGETLIQNIYRKNQMIELNRTESTACPKYQTQQTDLMEDMFAYTFI